MSETTAKIGVFAAKLAQDAMASGLTWDEAVAAFGLAAKAMAIVAVQAGDGGSENREAYARRRFEEAFAQNVSVIVARSDLTQLRAANADAEARALVANCSIKIALPH